MKIELSETKLFNIGQVCENLIEEFPQITVSKIRYLESQGLLTPTRTESGYRKFSTSDLDKLVWILRQQRDYFVPLKTIKEQVAEPLMVHGNCSKKKSLDIATYYLSKVELPRNLINIPP